MPLNRNIVHPRLFESLRPSFWRHTVTIQEATETRNEIGGIDKAWATLTGHTNISCNLGRKVEMSEQRETFATYDAKFPRAQLNGYWPLITEKHRATIEGAVYKIRGVISDSSLNQTELVLEIIT